MPRIRTLPCRRRIRRRTPGRCATRPRSRSCSVWCSRAAGKEAGRSRRTRNTASRRRLSFILRNWSTGLRKRVRTQRIRCFYALSETTRFRALESTVAGKAVGDRILRIRHLKQADDMQACQVLFLGKAQSKRIPMLVTNLHNAPVLTVGETAGFLDAGGMIDFLLEENKVRFDINLGAAESARLKIGSRLLILAQHVVGESHGK